MYCNRIDKSLSLLCSLSLFIQKIYRKMDDQPPLIWPQFESTGYTRRRSAFPTMLGPAVIGVISAAIFLLFVNFVVPPFLSITSQILQPASVKRGWDSINVVLVVFAILCGVLARQNDDGSSQSSHGEEDERGAVTSGEMTVGEDSKISSTSTVSAQPWFDDVYDADRHKIYQSTMSRSFSPGLPVTGTVPLRRSSSSYPDLRQGVFRETGDRPFRFYDDFEIDKYRSHDSSSSYQQFPNRSKIEIEEVSEPKEILVDTFVVKPSSPQQQPPAPPPPPPPPPPPAEVSQKPRRTRRSVKNRDIQENTKRSVTNSDSTRFKRAFVPPPSPPPPPPPPPPLVTATPPRKQGSLQRKKSNAAKEIKMVFTSLYNQGKRKKKLQKSKRKERSSESPVEEVMTEPPEYQSLIPPPSPPPPPPPPPPPLRSSQSVFYGLFKKGVKSNKKIHSVPAPPPPPPPRKIQLDPQTPPRRVKSGRPPRPTKPTNFNEENNGQGSPLRQITPPPPPPPPFRVPPLKFVVSGDFAKIRSNQSSRCSSPEREVIDIGWGLELTQSEGGVETIAAVGVPGFCPSPDVNTKADNFIARLRDEWRLDKINSVNRKR